MTRIGFFAVAAAVLAAFTAVPSMAQQERDEIELMRAQIATNDRHWWQKILA